MCGISGVVSRQRLSEELRAAVARMSGAQLHRGPDDHGEFYSPHAALASRRLSIIDISGGSQPVSSDDRSKSLVINGEIYNYLELRSSLEKAGRVFHTASDTEVVLRLYEEQGLDFVNGLRGMFALAIWDDNLQRLILARDRMGEKPLYLSESDGLIIFASELKGLLASGLIPFELDPASIDKYFHYQYIPEPFTALKNVRKLEAATMLIIDIADWQIETKRYWRLEDADELDGDPAELIRERLFEVGGLITRSDVPVGVALSGGLDSSITAAVAARSKSDVCAFSVGYAGRPACDERADAEAFADYLKIPFIDVELYTESIAEYFPELNFWRDDPVADIAGFGYYAVAKLARANGVPVLLQGQGGDELFWGYPELRAAINETLQKARLKDSPVFQSVYQTLSRESGISSLQRRRREIDQVNFYDMSPDFAEAREHTPTLYGKFMQGLAEEKGWIPFPADRSTAALEILLTSAVCSTYLRCNGIVQGDRLGMAASVEMRLPFVDHKFVETVIGLRKTRSDSELPPKQWLKDAVAGMLPQWVLNRPKRGFAPPTGEWKRALFAAHGDTLRDGFLTSMGILKSEFGPSFARGELNPNTDSSLPFKALVLEHWARQMKTIAG